MKNNDRQMVLIMIAIALMGIMAIFVLSGINEC